MECTMRHIRTVSVMDDCVQLWWQEVQQWNALCSTSEQCQSWMTVCNCSHASLAEE